MTRLITLIFALLSMLAAPSGAQAAGLPAGFVGISPQSFASRADFELMRSSGVTNVRLPLFWFAVQEEHPALADPNWEGFDNDVKLAAQSGIRIMPFIWGSPKWVAAEPGELPVETALQRRGWARVLREAVGRYGPGGEFWEENPELPYLPAQRWEIWNEQNIVTFAPRPEPEKFAKLIRIAGRVLHRADPASQVILGGFFGRPLQVPPNIHSGDYLSRVYRARRVKQHFDGVALHPYVSRARGMVAQIENLRRVMRLHKDAHTPLYITELGWGSQSGPTRWQRGLFGQAKELAKAFGLIARNRERWRIGGVWWYTWTDEGGGCHFCQSAGLLTADRKAKPSWYVFNAWTGGDPDTVPRAFFENGIQVAEDNEAVEE